MDAGIHAQSLRGDAIRNVGSIFEVDWAIDTKLSSCARRIQIEVSDAFRSFGIAEDGIKQLEVEVACRLRLPMRLAEVLEGAGHLDGVVAGAGKPGGDAQRAQIGRVAGQIQRGLNGAWGRSRLGARQGECRGSGLDVVALGPLAVAGT